MGKRCTKCGDHGWGLYIYPNGLCENCDRVRMGEEAKKRLADRLASNYLACQNGTARPSVLRVYEAFVKKYPEAQITGIGVPPDDERKLSVCLAGGIVYIATYNPLTNSVDVVEKGAVSKSSDNLPSENPKEKGFGAATFWSILSLLHSLLLLSLSTYGGFAALLASVVALGGCATKSSTAVRWGAVLHIFPLIIGLPYSLLCFVLMIPILLCA